MTAVLLDTNVISELASSRPDPNVIRFLEGVHDSVLSVVSVHELIYGAERTPVARRAKLLAWISSLKAEFSGRILKIDLSIAELAGQLRAVAANQGRAVTALDTLIAASAMSRSATLATRNIKDFEVFGVPLINPWKQ